MNWCYKHYAMIIPCLHHQEIYELTWLPYLQCLYELMLWLPNLHCAMFAPYVKISRTCIVILRIDILPYDEMLQLMNTWNVILYLIDFSINLCLSYMNLLNVVFEDDFRFDKCLIRIYDIRYTLNMNHASIMLNASIIFYL